MPTPRKKSHKTTAKKTPSKTVHTPSAKKNREKATSSAASKKKGRHKLLTAEGWKRLMFGKTSKKK